jgi:hypothetical protein
MLKDKAGNKKFKKKKRKKANSRKFPKPRLIFQVHNPWNHIPGLNQEAQFPINLIFKDEIGKKK